MQATENTRIRQREEEGEENISTTRRTRRRTDEGTTSGPDASRNYVNDDRFFFPGGDCVVAIDGTLFKVHRFQLTREGSTFADLLTLPTETGSAPEMTEENPLVLTDDIADFRALCWALYATPVQLYTYQGERIRTLDLLQVVCLLEIAHKYHFTAYEHWARDILIRHTDPRNLHRQFRFSYPSTVLARMLRLSEKCHSSKLRDNVEATWLLRFDSPGLALTTAEGLQLRQFQGKCYYKLVCNLGTIQLEGSSTAYVPYEMELSSEQRARLFQGAWSIQQFLRRLREDCCLPKKDAACDQARHNFACKQASQDFFGRGGDDDFLRSADPLQTIHNFLGQRARSQHQGTCVLKHLVNGYHNLEDSLADHFLGSCGP